MSYWIDRGGEVRRSTDCFIVDAIVGIGAALADVGAAGAGFGALGVGAADAAIGAGAGFGALGVGAADAAIGGLGGFGALGVGAADAAIGGGLGAAGALAPDLTIGALGADAALPAGFLGGAAVNPALVGADVAGTALGVAPGVGGAPTSVAGGLTPASIAGTPATGAGGAGLSAASAGAAPGDVGAVAPLGTGGGAPASIGSVSSDLAPDLTIGTTPNSTAGLEGITAAPSGAPLGPNSFENLINSPSLGNAVNFAKNNTSLLTGIGGLAFQELNKPKLPDIGPLTKSANQLGKQATQLTQAELTGKLPPGAQAGVNQAIQANEARIRSQFASMGLSGSSMEAEAINQAQLQGQSLGFQIAQQMAQQGLSEAQLSNSVYAQLLQTQLQQDQLTSQAIANFAAAAGGGNTIRLVTG